MDETSHEQGGHPRWPLEKMREEAMIAASVHPLLVAAVHERKRQMVELGYDRDHDDQHENGELALAAASYALGLAEARVRETVWPWQPKAFSEGDRKVELAKAVALLLAEFDRLARAGEVVLDCPAHGPHPHEAHGGKCLDCPACAPVSEEKGCVRLSEEPAEKRRLPFARGGPLSLGGVDGSGL